jgi:hypothetical protein
MSVRSAHTRPQAFAGRRNGVSGLNRMLENVIMECSKFIFSKLMILTYQINFGKFSKFWSRDPPATFCKVDPGRTSGPISPEIGVNISTVCADTAATLCREANRDFR